MNPIVARLTLSPHSNMAAHWCRYFLAAVAASVIEQPGGGGGGGRACGRPDRNAGGRCPRVGPGDELLAAGVLVHQVGDGEIHGRAPVGPKGGPPTISCRRGEPVKRPSTRCPS